MIHQFSHVWSCLPNESHFITSALSLIASDSFTPPKSLPFFSLLSLLSYFLRPRARDDLLNGGRDGGKKREEERARQKKRAKIETCTALFSALLVSSAAAKSCCAKKGVTTTPDAERPAGRTALSLDIVVKPLLPLTFGGRRARRIWPRRAISSAPSQLRRLASQRREGF